MQQKPGLLLPYSENVEELLIFRWQQLSSSPFFSRLQRFPPEAGRKNVPGTAPGDMGLWNQPDDVPAQGGQVERCPLSIHPVAGDGGGIDVAGMLLGVDRLYVIVVQHQVLPHP